MNRDFSIIYAKVVDFMVLMPFCKKNVYDKECIALTPFGGTSFVTEILLCVHYLVSDLY